MNVLIEKRRKIWRKVLKHRKMLKKVST